MAQVLVKPISAHFVAEYADLKGVPKKDEVDPIFIIDPPPAARNIGIASLLQRKVPLRFTDIVSCQSAKSNCSRLVLGPAMPALLINASRPPSFVSTPLKKLMTSASSETFATIAKISS